MFLSYVLSYIRRANFVLNQIGQNKLTNLFSVSLKLDFMAQRAVIPQKSLSLKVSFPFLKYTFTYIYVYFFLSLLLPCLTLTTLSSHFQSYLVFRTVDRPSQHHPCQQTPAPSR
jgi:hypothetical protein